MSQAGKTSITSGVRFGRWTVLHPEQERAPDRQIIWLCRCDCGNERRVKAGALRSGLSSSCGCRPVLGTQHPLWRRWYNMIQRCTNPDFPDWHKYGARGIKVCDRWLDFGNFLADMEPSFKPGTQMDRINNSGHYEPGNVRWTTATVNIRNRRTTVTMETPWGRMTPAEAADRLGVDFRTFDSHRRKGWSYERLFGLTSQNQR